MERDGHDLDRLWMEIVRGERKRGGAVIADRKRVAGKPRQATKKAPEKRVDPPQKDR